MKRVLMCGCIGLLLSGCATHRPTAVLAAPASHSNGDLTNTPSIAGFVYQIDAQQLVLRSEHAALRFRLPPSAEQEVSQGKHLSDLRQGDLIRVHVGYRDQGMAVESFDLLPHPHSNSPEHAWPAYRAALVSNPRKKGDINHEETHP